MSAAPVGPDSPAADEWYDWLLRRRHGGDPAQASWVATEVAGFVDRVLDGARLAPGMRMLDLGAGEGVVGFRAVERIGPSLHVLDSDISLGLLAHAQAEALRRGLSRQFQFIHRPASDLNGIEDGSIDAVTARSALAYVADKPAAFREAMRVLKPGGWFSVGEPVYRDEALALIASRAQWERLGRQNDTDVLPLLLRWRAAQFPDTVAAMEANPLTNFSERELVAWACESGFVEVHLEFHIDVRKAPGVAWATFLAASPHPWAPTAQELLDHHFSADEQARLEAAIRPVIEAGHDQARSRMAYLSARKPVARAASS